MGDDWRQADAALRQPSIIGSNRNEPVTVTDVPGCLRCIGVGTDAAVFVHGAMPAYAFKVYSELAASKLPVEADVYLQLEGLTYFPRCYGHGDRYLVLSREEGPTLHDCLLQGIEVPASVMRDVAEAREAVRSRGLNPRDIHLKNVLLQNGRAKLLDVSEYALPGDDQRWAHLEWAYEVIYPTIAGRKVPEWALDALKRGYAKLGEQPIDLDDYADRIRQWVRKLREL